MELQGAYLVAAYVAAVLMMGIGFAGTLVPVLPGLPLMYAGMLLAAWVDQFQRVGTVSLVGLGLLTVLSLVVDYWASALGAKRVGASRLAIYGAMIGTVAGLFFVPWGLLFGPFIGAAAGELIHRKPLQQAARVGVGTWVGILLGAVVKVAMACTMAGWFALAWFV
ncbi:MAG: DUF456 domain-containing protein [Desulfobulbus sp.]|jgi:uncharacterized protein YqgC (DUF456 family)